MRYKLGQIDGYHHLVGGNEGNCFKFCICLIKIIKRCTLLEGQCIKYKSANN